MKTDNDLLTRNVIASASADTIAVEVNGREEIRSWDSVTSAGATFVNHGEAKIFVIAIAFDDGRTFVVGEIDTGWPQVIEFLHVGLPGVEPFTSWGPRLLAEPGVVALFDRGE
ncbi:hypothetical protein U1839_21150 [Sphingomonas sp. RT2P30]